MSSVAELLFYRNFSDSNLIQIGKKYKFVGLE